MTATRTRRSTGISINRVKVGRPARDRAAARLIRATFTALSGRLHAPADTRARDMGWTVTVVPGPLGLNGRSYRDLRFGTGPER
jgi:hypothetical protein